MALKRALRALGEHRAGRRGKRPREGTPQPATPRASPFSRAMAITPWAPSEGFSAEPLSLRTPHVDTHHDGEERASWKILPVALPPPGTRTISLSRLPNCSEPVKAFQSFWDLPFAIFSLPFEVELSRCGKCSLSTLGWGWGGGPRRPYLPTSHGPQPRVTWRPCTGRGRGGRALCLGLYGHRSQMSHPSSLPGGGAVERPGPKAWGGGRVGGNELSREPASFLLHPTPGLPLVQSTNPFDLPLQGR